MAKWPCVCAGLCVFGGRPEVNVRYLPQLLSTLIFFFETESFIEPGLQIWIAWLDSNTRDPPFSLSSTLEL